MSDSQALATAEAVAAEAKARYRAEPSPEHREAHRAAQTALREARWVARGGLDNPYGAQCYADALMAEKEQRRTGCCVTVEYITDGVPTFTYGDAVSATAPFAHVEGSDE